MALVGGGQAHESTRMKSDPVPSERQMTIQFPKSVEKERRPCHYFGEGDRLRNFLLLL
jgi:hypothetical protein